MKQFSVYLFCHLAWSRGISQWQYRSSFTNQMQFKLKNTENN